MSVNFYDKNTGNLTNIAGGGTGGGADYDIEVSANKDSVTLTENSTDKTTLPLISEFIGTRAEWNALSATDKEKYRKVNITDEMAIYNRNPSTGELTSLIGESNIENLTPTQTKELTTTATKTHTKGDYFNLNGTFVKAKSNIAIGDTLTEGTNYETTNVGTELTDIESDLSTVSSNLGNKSSASSVSGSTAFAKINTLNNDVTDLNEALDKKAPFPDYSREISFISTSEQQNVSYTAPYDGLLFLLGQGTGSIVNIYINDHLVALASSLTNEVFSHLIPIRAGQRLSATSIHIWKASKLYY